MYSNGSEMREMAEIYKQNERKVSGTITTDSAYDFQYPVAFHTLDDVIIFGLWWPLKTADPVHIVYLIWKCQQEGKLPSVN